MKAYRIIRITMLSLALFFSTLFAGTIHQIFAEDLDFIHVQDDGITYLEDSEGCYHYYFDTSGNPVSVEEARRLLSVQTVQCLPEYPARGGVYNYAEYYTQNQISGARTKITPDVAGPASISYGTSVTTSATWSYSFQIGFKNVIISKINMNVSVSYANSSSSSSSFSATFNIPGNKIGAVYFTPYLMNTYVRTWDADGVYRLANIRYPRKLSSGFTDGLYELVLR